MSKKIRGIVSVKITAITKNLMLGKEIKSGELISFMTKYKVNRPIGAIVNVKCIKIESGLYKLYGFCETVGILGRRAQVVKKIAYENLMKEVEKDYNPVSGRSIQSKMRNGAGGINYARLSGKIGGAIIRNIKRDTDTEKRVIKFKAERRDLVKKIREREKHIENSYYNWLEKTKKEDNDKNWDIYLRKEKHATSTERMIETFHNDKQRLAELEREEAEFFTNLQKEAESISKPIVTEPETTDSECEL